LLVKDVKKDASLVMDLAYLDVKVVTKHIMEAQYSINILERIHVDMEALPVLLVNL
jgi:hypothetical protein